MRSLFLTLEYFPFRFSLCTLQTLYWTLLSFSWRGRLLQLQQDGPHAGHVLAMSWSLCTEVTVFGDSLPLRARLDMIHASHFCHKVRLSLAVGGLGFLQLSFVASIPIFQLLPGLETELFFHDFFILIFLFQSLFLVYFPLFQKLRFFSGNVHV